VPREVACHGNGLSAEQSALIPWEESADGIVGMQRAEGLNGREEDSRYVEPKHGP
jgi:hypothetical protein